MNDDQTNHVRMIRTVRDYCGTTPVVAATGGITAFAPMVTDTSNKLVLIDGFDMIAKGDTKGVTDDTKQIRAAMEAIAFRCARGTLAYANSVNNNTLKAKVNYTKSKLSDMKMDEVDDVSEVIRTETNNNIGAVTAYGVLAGDPAALTAAITLYRASISKTRQAIITITGAITQIDQLIHVITFDNFKGQMDPMMDTLIGTNDEVVRGYKQARVILDLSHTTGKIRGECRDETNNTLDGVIFKVYEAGTTTLVGQDVSKLGGKFGVAGLLGDYDCTWEKPGKVTVSETGIHVAAGKELRRKIKMLPI